MGKPYCQPVAPVVLSYHAAQEAGSYYALLRFHQINPTVPINASGMAAR